MIAKLADTRLAVGGLFRCCVDTFYRWAAEQRADAQVSDGQRVPCAHCRSGVVLDGKTWRWDRDGEGS